MKPVVKHTDGFKIRISQLPTGLHEYHFSSEPREIGLESNFRGRVEVYAGVDKLPRQLYVKARIRTSGLFNCDRCVEEFEHSLEASYSMFYVYDDAEGAKFPTEEVQVISPDAVCIDLAEDVSQVVTLSVPLKLLCREDCKGLCPRCGTNWNRKPCNCSAEGMDPRWNNLEQLLNK